MSNALKGWQKAIEQTTMPEPVLETIESDDGLRLSPIVLQNGTKLYTEDQLHAVMKQPVKSTGLLGWKCDFCGYQENGQYDTFCGHCRRHK